MNTKMCTYTTGVILSVNALFIYSFLSTSPFVVSKDLIIYGFVSHLMISFTGKWE